MKRRCRARRGIPHRRVSRCLAPHHRNVVASSAIMLARTCRARARASVSTQPDRFVSDTRDAAYGFHAAMRVAGLYGRYRPTGVFLPQPGASGDSPQTVETSVVVSPIRRFAGSSQPEHPGSRWRSLSTRTAALVEGSEQGARVLPDGGIRGGCRGLPGRSEELARASAEAGRALMLLRRHLRSRRRASCRRLDCLNSVEPVFGETGRVQVCQHPHGPSGSPRLKPH